MTEKLAKAKAIVLADYHGLSVAQVSRLRQKVKEVGGELAVAKNTLLKLALKKTDHQLPADYQLTGPTIALFSFEDEITPLKILSGFAQENQLPKIKQGFLGKALLTIERVEELAKLPGKEQLKAMLLTRLNWPINGLVFVLKGNLQKLTLALEAIKNQKSMSS